MATLHDKVTQVEHEALLRLLRVAAGNTGQSRRVADFLLAWWNAGSCGAFDITTAWGLDAALAHDVITVFTLAVQCGSYPDTLGYSKEFERVVHAWRPGIALRLRSRFDASVVEARERFNDLRSAVSLDGLGPAPVLPVSSAQLDLCPKCAGSLPADGGACGYCAKEVSRVD